MGTTLFVWLVSAWGTVVFAGLQVSPAKRVVVVARLEVVDVRQGFAVADGFETPLSPLIIGETIPLSVAAWGTTYSIGRVS